MFLIDSVGWLAYFMNDALADAIIYATAQLQGATLVTSDTHLDGLPGVTIIPHPNKGKSS